MTVSKLSRGRPPATETRRRILEAAGRRLGAQGYERTRVEDIAADVGIGRSAVLYHFGDKRSLYQAVLDEHNGESLRRMRDALSRPGSLEERLACMIDRLVDQIAERPEIAQITLRNATNADPDLRKDSGERATPFVRMLIDVLDQEGTHEDAYADALRLGSALFGTALFYVAALPTFAGPLRDDHLAPGRVSTLKGDLLAIAVRVLDATPDPTT